MKLGILNKHSPVDRLLWLQIPPLARFALIAESVGDVGNVRLARLATVAAAYK